MHFDLPEASPAADIPDSGKPWYRELNRFHWFVLIVCALGWLFDTMDQQLFMLARRPALVDLLPPGPDGTVAARDIQWWSGIVTAIFLLGWATGGLVFGVLGDRFGRARVMAWTILAYSVCTGLSALSQSVYDFSVYRFLTGLGVGGEFAVGVALVAEVMPPRTRPYALGFVQALSAVGNASAAGIQILFGELEIENAWRWMFVVGAAPALLVVVIRRGLKEPESWQAAVAAERANPQARKHLASTYGQLFGDPVLRHRAIIGMLLAFAGVVGLWGIVFFTVDMFGAILSRQFTAEALANNQTLTKEQLDGMVGSGKGVLSLMLQLGAFFGMYSFAPISEKIGRKPTFALAFIAAGLSTAATFWYLDKYSEMFWMVPIMGFCIFTLFGGYAVYLPELFPTRVRSTATSFCYNVGRFVAASGPFALGLLTSVVYSGISDEILRYRYAGITMCSIFAIGLLALPFAPETKGKPLPE